MAMVKDVKKEKVPASILELIKKREEFRKKKQWSKADKIRRQVKKLGYFIDDTTQGPKLKN